MLLRGAGLLLLSALLVAPSHPSEKRAGRGANAAPSPESPAIAPPTAPTAAPRAPPRSKPPCGSTAAAAAGAAGGWAGSNAVCGTAQA
jgi:hypothetical protein